MRYRNNIKVLRIDNDCMRRKLGKEWTKMLLVIIAVQPI